MNRNTALNDSNFLYTREIRKPSHNGIEERQGQKLLESPWQI